MKSTWLVGSLIVGTDSQPEVDEGLIDWLFVCTDSQPEVGVGLIDLLSEFDWLLEQTVVQGGQGPDWLIVVTDSQSKVGKGLIDWLIVCC